MTLGRPDARTDRLPPHAPEAEAGILGCVLLSPKQCLDQAREKLRDDNAFYDERHKCIWHTLCLMADKPEPIDLITLHQRLKDRGLLEQVGGLPFLNALQDATPSAANLPSYLEIVVEKWTLRHWLAFGAEITRKIYDSEADVDQLTAEISQEAFRLCESRLTTPDRTFGEIVADVHAFYISKFRRGVKFRLGPQTGFNFVDNILPGFGPGQLIFLAARPGTGKSAWMMQVAEHIALVEKEHVGVFTLEMTALSLGLRALFQRAGADLTKFLNGFMETADLERLVGASHDLSTDRLHVDESPTLAVEDFAIRARRMVAQYGVKIIFGDYFQLMFSRKRQRNWNTQEEMAHISKCLKGLARELKIPIVWLSQMSRAIEKDAHRRPKLSDLRDTGQMEQDGDVILFLWKPDLNKKTWKKRIPDILARLQMVPEPWRTAKSWNRQLSIVTCTIEKQREGRAPEDATLVFIKPWTRFVDAYNPPSDRLGEGEDKPPEHEVEDQDDLIDPEDVPS